MSEDCKGCAGTTDNHSEFCPAVANTDSITPHVPKRYTRAELVAHWRALFKEHRISEVSNRRHGNEDLAKWHEGKADAFDRCADMLEHLFVP